MAVSIEAAPGASPGRMQRASTEAGGDYRSFCEHFLVTGAAKEVFCAAAEAATRSHWRPWETCLSAFARRNSSGGASASACLSRPQLWTKHDHTSTFVDGSFTPTYTVDSSSRVVDSAPTITSTNVDSTCTTVDMIAHLWTASFHNCGRCSRFNPNINVKTPSFRYLPCIMHLPPRHRQTAGSAIDHAPPPPPRH